MKCTAISDLHGYYPRDLIGGDLLIIAGDITANDKVYQWNSFYNWLRNQNYRKMVYIAGNHDGMLESCLNSTQRKEFYKQTGLDEDGESFEYLCDSGTEFEGYKIWGTPWTPNFFDWHFMKERGEPLKAMWDLIPTDTDILVTHGPAFGILDPVNYFNYGLIRKKSGCEELRKKFDEGILKPKVHICGHIHEGYGEIVSKYEGYDIHHINASIMNIEYEPVNAPINFELKDRK